MNLPDPAPIISLIEGFRRSKTMFAAVNLGVFDALTNGPASSDELSATLQTNGPALVRLLEACVSLGLLEVDTGRYVNSQVAAVYLSEASENSLAGYIRFSNDALYPMWAHLEDAVKEGTPRWQQTFGWPAPIFEHFFSTPEKMRTFSMGMHGFGLTTSPTVVRAFDLGRFRKLVDLGAATGHLAIAACEAWPQMRGVAFDLPQVIPLAKEQIAKSDAKDRLSAVDGDFFQDRLPAGDIYALGRILHDWGVEKIHLLLRRIYDALPAGGALLIAEKLLDEDRAGPVSAHMQSLSMLICTEGRERSLAEYCELLREAGFTGVEGRSMGKYLDAILAVKG